MSDQLKYFAERLPVTVYASIDVESAGLVAAPAPSGSSGGH